MNLITTKIPCVILTIVALFSFSYTLSISAENITTQYKKAYFAGGCFWCVESNYEKIPGIIEVISGYSGGHIKNPSYEQVSSGSSGHVEAVEVIYDAHKVSYNDLLIELWHLIDPTDGDGSFVDRGKHYRYRSGRDQYLEQTWGDDLHKRKKI
ncbi:MAG: peptide-methionine (S)-S-oxide reductase MsrA [gamma proteobacterium symbiont of Taylorina sp.]|nr:peptide-methionine (S)-S-oxide reductase MsrA [gamma proteobacterium symbiont of Taylorina sp.]